MANNTEKNAMQRLNALILQKNSRICAGLDPTWEMIPKTLKNKFFYDEPEEERAIGEEDRKEIYKEQIFRAYCKKYIQAVKDVVPAIKINSAFFEAENLENLYWDIAYEAQKVGLFVIGDVKRADIGSTSQAYAQAFLTEDSPFDAITINPYFGSDGVMPFMKMAKENGKGVFVLVKTSNKSSCEIQDLVLEDGRKVYEAVANLVTDWTEKVEECDYYSIDDYSMVGAVVGATHPEQLGDLTDWMGNNFVLVPGYGAQGATADDVVAAFDGEGLGAIINSSRGIMQAYKKDCWKAQYSEETWAEAAKAEAIRATEEINQALVKRDKL